MTVHLEAATAGTLAKARPRRPHWRHFYSGRIERQPFKDASTGWEI